MEEEVWKDIPGWEGLYQASSHGRIESLERMVLRSDGRQKKVNGCILKAGLNSDGYYTVVLCKNAKMISFKVSVLVGMTFLNHKPDGTNKTVVDHKDNIKTNNYLSNLQLITNRENLIKFRLIGNYSSKYVGVYWHKRAKKWCSQIQINGKMKYLGLFVNEEEAHETYQNELKNV